MRGESGHPVTAHAAGEADFLIGFEPSPALEKSREAVIDGQLRVWKPVSWTGVPNVEKLLAEADARLAAR